MVIYSKNGETVTDRPLKGRPKKKKIIQQCPRVEQFSPRGRAGRPLEIVLPVEEYEAVRLADHKGMPQKQASRMMDISQQSFSRIVRSARKKISDAIVNAKSIHIDRGEP